MSETRGVVFLVDVDNTLLDNDQVERDLAEHLEGVFGIEYRKRYWEIFEALRAEVGYADYLGALQRYRVEYLRDPQILEMSSFLIDYPFADRLYPGALQVIERLRGFGQTVIFSDGDAVFQPRKIRRSGIAPDGGQVLVYIHKEQMLEDVEQKYPADHYVAIDDKVRILAAMKKIWGTRLTTVAVRQGHYAMDRAAAAQYARADFEVEKIGDLLGEGLASILKLGT